MTLLFHSISFSGVSFVPLAEWDSGRAFGDSSGAGTGQRLALYCLLIIVFTFQNTYYKERYKWSLGTMYILPGNVTTDKQVFSGKV